jgi:four helix bundle protein
MCASVSCVVGTLSFFFLAVFFIGGLSGFEPREFSRGRFDRHFIFNRDRDYAQLSRASESIALNLAEGRARRDGDRRRHYEMAAGSASEVTVALRIARTKRYITSEDEAAMNELLDRVRAMLYRLTR